MQNTIITLFIVYYITCLSIRWYAALKQRQLIIAGKADFYEVSGRFDDVGFFSNTRVNYGYKDIKFTPVQMFLQGFVWILVITFNLLINSISITWLVFVALITLTFDSVGNLYKYIVQNINGTHKSLKKKDIKSADIKEIKQLNHYSH